ncbi:hypothetical protein N0V83_004150 [Neocucurbitaria cava]|uniref:Alpha/beta hydrolase fold-3 domain-containing protein n=1 Tax=Neocucurbitaria cava TaxID=798079 RepID=A0A9W8YD58_9PLEO|nr:hypothetical protein N0V83_004150 [Neocucurbitaria cava]
MASSSEVSQSKRMTRDDLDALSIMTEEFFTHNGAPLSLGDANSIITGRNAVSPKALRDALGPVPPSIEESEIQIPIPNSSWTSRALLTRPPPSSSTTPGPLIVLYHGGGFVLGQPEGVLVYARAFTLLFNATVICASYRLAPEFPIGANDAYDILTWCATNATTTLRADPSKGFIVGGNSAGANFAAVLARRSVEEGLTPRLTGQWLSYPLMAHHDATREGVEGLVEQVGKYKELWGVSWEMNRDAPLIDAEAAKTLFSCYEPDLKSPRYNPLVRGEPREFDVARFPKALVQVAGLDIMRDDGIVYAYALEDAGVEVRLLAYKGVPHAFPAFFPTLQASKQALVDIAMGFGWLMGIEIEEEMARNVMLKRA